MVSNRIGNLFGGKRPYIRPETTGHTPVAPDETLEPVDVVIDGKRMKMRLVETFSNGSALVEDERGNRVGVPANSVHGRKRHGTDDNG